MICGLLGGKLGHSYSPLIHRHLGAYTYNLYERTPDQLCDFLKHGDFHGINVTIPYKKAVIPYCTHLSEIAQELGSVNTIIRNSDGELFGHNTDYFGFESMVERSCFVAKGKKALILGSGGASITATAVLNKLGANTVVISRSGENNYSNLHLHKDAALIVNTTPVGMYPNNGETPVDLEQFPNVECVLDLIYNPARTKLLLDAEARGIPCQNGLWMLIAQAKAAAELFADKPIDNRKISKIYQQISAECENIVLIGMPGCGKSTVGKLLAEKLNRTFLDADAQIEQLAQKSIPELFALEGEDAFRKLETQVLSELGKFSGLVIATGGGCVTKEENYPLLHQNSRIYWLQRELSRLPVDGRPLSQTNSLEDIYKVRLPLYQQFADRTVNNDGSPEETVSAILSLEVTK